MSIYAAVLFFHILGAFGLIAALAIETLALHGLRSAESGEQARPWLGAYRTLRILAPASIAVILLAGLYLMASAWGWRGWIVSGLVGLFLIGVIGGVLNGTRMARLGPALGRARGALSDDLRGMVLDPMLVISSRLRIGLVIGVLFLMSVKPPSLLSAATLLVSALLGLAWAQLELRSRHTSLRRTPVRQ